MKITAVRLNQLEGVLEHEGELWEERLVRPIDIYPDYRAQGAGYTPKIEEGKYRIRAIFVELHTDEGVTGLAGPVSGDLASLIAHQFKPLLIGRDPIAHETLWDQMYRQAVHGRKGPPMMAISALDCALWDLRGKWFDAPVYRLLGGPTRETVPAYASALGYALDPEAVSRRAGRIAADGYTATKWFFRHGPAEGRSGMARNVELVRALRESVGDDVDLMLDAWMSWDVPYTRAMAERIAEFRPRWIEEPVLPDRIESCAAIRSAVSVPIATGEHEYTRWGFKALIAAGAADVLQPDIYWAGGLSEVQKICTLASTHDLVVVPHGHSVPTTLHLLAAQPPDVCPILEYLINWNKVLQFFLRNPIVPENGVVGLPQGPGMGLELDENKIQSQQEWTG